MPNPSDYDSQDKWMAVCVPKMMDEGKPNEQAVAACMNMWETQDKAAKWNAQHFGVAVKALEDWTLDVNAIPFFNKDSDGQNFDDSTNIMPDVFQNPLIVYQHGIAQGAKALSGTPLIIGKAVAGSLNKQADGWHIRVVLDRTIKQARDIWEAAKKGLVAVSSGSISHLARLDIGGKMHMYDKGKPGRIAVWPLAEVSLWEQGNGNMRPANRFAYAMPTMKAIYRAAKVPFPELDTTGAVSDAVKAARRAEILQASKTILQRADKRKEKE
jgi:hypothetical protein